MYYRTANLCLCLIRAMWWFMDARKTCCRAPLFNLYHFSFALTRTLIRSFLLQFPEWEFPEDWISLSVLMAECFQPSAYIRTKHTVKNNTINVLSSLTDKVQWSSHCMLFNFTEYLVMLCITVFTFHISYLSHAKTISQIPTLLKPL